MLCQKCGKKEAVVHVVCMVNNKQIDKWLCADCAEKLMPYAIGGAGGRAADARNLLETLFFGGEAPKHTEARRFTKRMASILETAMRSALDRGHDHLGTEHLLLALLNEKDCYGIRVLEKLGVNPVAVAEELEKVMDPAGNLQIIIGYTPRAKRALEIAAETAVALKCPQVGSEHLLMGILREDKGMGGNVLRKFNITAEQVWQIIRSIREHQPAVPGFEEPEMPEYEEMPQEVSLEVLNEFGRNLNELAAEGKIDPVIGRENEIERVIQILCRRTKNNPVLIGEAGVGKTSVAEGLAQRIVEGKVPELLRNKTVFSLEIGYLVAGAKYRGDFEERLKDILETIKENKDIILFIDELHTIIGAGAGEGGTDAANIIKPALARGELQVVGATTLSEYRKHIEKDAALERRFQPVVVSAPDADAALEILKGLRKKYEEFHKLHVSDAALEAAVRLSNRYITDRNLPDKAIDLMDEACAKVKLQNYKLSIPVVEKEKELAKVRREKAEAIASQQYERAAQLRDHEAILELALGYEKTNYDSAVSKSAEVTEEDIASVISQWLNIPLQRLTQTESERLLHMESDLHKRVIGQNEAVEAVSKAIRRARAGFKDKNRPVGSFLFLGPTGVGKTELAKALAENLFGDERALIRFDMSEYMEKHTASRLVGAPPGYVGYEEGGQLTDAVRRRPYSIILLDEIEKAHPDVFNLLLQIMEDGRLTDGQGRTTDFKNCVIIMTSNAGARLLADTKPLGFAVSGAEEENSRKDKVLAEIKNVFRPEFLNRIDEITVFDSLHYDDLVQIIRNMLRELRAKLAENGLTLEISQEARELLVKEGSDTRYGARPLRRAVRKMLEDPVSDLYLAGRFKAGDTICASVGEDGKIKFMPKKVEVVVTHEEIHPAEVNNGQNQN
ncbi:MAG: NDP-hexose 4-ketoreductase [Phascolarctobacterium sp.]|nr:MAG: NDP-hexose 4-ketoreductase [Phascolarctobacterium sp.]